MRRILLSLVFLSLTFFVNAQNDDNVLAKQLVTKNAAAIGLSQDDLNNFIVSSSYFNQTAGTQMVYLVQGYKGLPIFNQMLVLAFKDGKVVSKAGEFLPNLESLIRSGSANPTVNPESAVRTAITDAKLAMPAFVMVLKTLDNGKKFDFGKLDIATENITAELMWVPVREGVTMTGIKLAWQVQLFPKANSDYWNIRVDANSNTVIDKNNLTVYENIESYHNLNNYSSVNDYRFSIPSSLSTETKTPFDFTGNGPSLVNTANYTVIRYPAEAPSFPGGAAAMTTNPWLLAGGNAVTLGWHNDGAVDYTTSRGNNVHAHEDQANNNSNNGIMATSTTTPDPLNFNFPPNYTLAPTTPLFQQFAITNLFYWNNILHDIAYKYGFDEPSGNFQNNNLGRGGLGVDYVQADAQDGGGTNNANFATPPDGTRPRMQMYLFSPAAGILTFVVNSPASIAGPYAAVEGAFSTNNLLGNVGPKTGDLVYYNDVAASTHEACVTPSNGGALTGKIALINRGNCTFVIKVKNAQDAGAIAVVMVNNAPGPPIVMGGADNTITIPAIMVSDITGALLVAHLGDPTNVTMSSTPPGTVQLDGDIDNGIVAHEFFHGVSNRLTGGPANSGCLSNAEEGGEGWSDYNALMTNTDWSTALITDGNNKARPIGTYAFGQPPTGNGIRLYPYCTNLAINPLTYANMGIAPVGTEVHNIGEIWCMAVWEMTWSIIQTDGINPNLFNNAGAGGNSVAYKLVMEGLKLQPCSPGYVDARNAIIQADQNLYGGAHYCAIWTAFAKRGLGANASQGSPFSATDQTADFSIPAGVNITSQPANSTACNGQATSFTVGISGGGSVTYLWQVSTTGAGGPWTNLTNTPPYSGVTTPTLNINPVTNAMNGYQYRLTITSPCGVGTSNPAVLTVIAAAVGGTVAPANYTTCTTPNSSTFTLSGNIGPITRWESSTVGAGGPFTTPIANTTNTLTVTNIVVSTWYRAVISAAGCTTATSTVGSVTVLPGSLPMFIVANPGSTLCAGDPTLLTVMEGAGSTPASISCSSSQAIVSLNSVSCNAGGLHTDNSYWRAFQLAFATTFTINSVTFGIELANAAGTGTTQPIVANVYTQSGGAFPGGTRTLVGTQTFNVPDQALTLFTGNFATPIAVPGNAAIVLEIFTPSGQAAGHSFFIGSNPAAQSCASYISAAACGIAAPTDLAAIGFPNMHVVMSLDGATQAAGTQVAGGTFLWSPAAGLSSTTTNPVAASPAATTTYTVIHNNGAGCIRQSSITIIVNQRPTVTTQPANATICSTSSATFTVAGTGTGLTYQWQESTNGGGLYTNLANVAPYSGVNTATLTINPVTLAMNNNRYRCVLSGTCAPAGTANISNGAILSVNALPVVTITPASGCGGVAGINGLALTTGGVSLPPVPGTVTVTTGTISVPIPDGVAAATTNILNIATVPANATITNIRIGLSMPHTYPADMIINLKAPNGQILSLYKHNTNTDNGPASVPTAGFFGAVVSSSSVVQFKAVPTPYRYGITVPTGPYQADALNGVTSTGYTIMDPTGFVSNAAGFGNLYTTGASANGAWTLALADGGAGDVGTLTNWSITIDYTTPAPGAPITYTWSPATGLYSDPLATIPYVAGTPAATVYAAPTTYTVYTVTAVDGTTGCVSTATAKINYTPPAPNVTPNPVAMCLGDAAVKLKSSSSTNVTTTFSSGTISVAVPDNTANGVTSTITVSGIPIGAPIAAMTVRLTMPHTYPADMIFNLRAPNGQIFNLYKHNTNTNNGAASVPTAGFFNAAISSTAAVVFSTVPTPYQYGITAPAGPYRPDALNGPIVNPGYTIMDPTGFASNAANFAALYSTPNGVWTLAMADGGPGDLGTLTSWSIDITHVLGVPATPAVWSPVAGLFSNAGATTAYVAGTPVDSVWVKPTPSGVYNYTARVQSVPVLDPIGNPATNFAAGNGNFVITFNVKNNNLFPVTLTDIASLAFAAGASNVEAWYSTTSISGSPGAITGPTWTQFGTASITAIGGTTVQPFMSGLGLVVPAGATYRILVSCATTAGGFNMGYSTLAGGVSTFSSGGCDIITGDLIGYGGGAIPSVPGNTPRGFIGNVRFSNPVAPCTSPARTVVVTVNDPTTVNAQPVNQTICTDKIASFTVTAGGSGPFTYQWQESINSGNTWTNIANGGVYSGATTATLIITGPPVSMNGNFYRCIVTGAAPCASITTAQRLLTVNPLPVIVISANPRRLLPGMTTTFTSTVNPNAAGPGGYAWLRNGAVLSSSSLGVNSGIGTGSINVNVDGLGDYSLRVTDVFGCTSTSNVISITDSASGKCFIYPNPNSGMFQVRYYSAANNVLPRMLTVYDAKGDQVLTKTYTIGRPYDRMDVDLRRNGKGLYWVEIGDMNGKRLTMCRVVIQ